MNLSKSCLSLFLIVIVSICSMAQSSHELDGKREGALLGTGGVTFGLGLYFLGRTPNLEEEEIKLLDPLNVNNFDRPTTQNWSPKAHKLSLIHISEPTRPY